MDPLEGSSTSLLPSVPGPRRSSRRRTRTGESLLQYDSDMSVNGGGLSPSRSRSPHTPPASRRARGRRARGGRARGGSSPSPSRSPHTPPASRARGGPARGGPARRGPARGGRARRGPARGGRARRGPARGGPARGGPARGGRGRGGGGGPSSSGPPSEPPSSSDDASSGSSSSSEEDTDARIKRFPRPWNCWDRLLCQKWRKHEPNNAVFPFAGPQPGPTVPVTRTTTACDLFDRFFTGEVWRLIIVESNRHASELNLANWVDITLPEIRAFVGLLLVMGILRLPRLELYWTEQYPLIYTKVREVMVKTRFLAILRALHLNDSSLQVPKGQPGYDPLFKVRKLLDLVTPRFEDQFNLDEWVSIDEAMIPFKGRLSFKQYMKDKPTKWGIKVFVLADAKTGYTKRIQIYTGKNENLTTAMDLGLTIRVVLGLMDGLEGSHIKKNEGGEMGGESGRERWSLPSHPPPLPS